VADVAVVAAPGDVLLEDTRTESEPSLLEDQGPPFRQTLYGEPLL
jgi:hypothetical protein